MRQFPPDLLRRVEATAASSCPSWRCRLPVHAEREPQASRMHPSRNPVEWCLYPAPPEGGSARTPSSGETRRLGLLSRHQSAADAGVGDVCVGLSVRVDNRLGGVLCSRGSQTPTGIALWGGRVRRDEERNGDRDGCALDDCADARDGGEFGRRFFLHPGPSAVVITLSEDERAEWCVGRRRGVGEPPSGLGSSWRELTVCRMPLLGGVLVSRPRRWASCVASLRPSGWPACRTRAASAGRKPIWS